MKASKCFFTFLAMLILGAGIMNSQAQNFEGVIKYEVPGMQAGQSGELSYMIKGSKIRMEMGKGQQTAAMLFNTDKSEMIVIVPQMKGYMKTDMNAGGQQTDEWEESEMNQTGETKTIAGHSCEVWNVQTDKGADYRLCMAKGLGTFVTPGNPMGQQSAPAWAKKVAAGEYMPLEVIEIDNGSEKLQMRATSIKEKSLDESLFTVPDNYRDVTEMMKKMQGN